MNSISDRNYFDKKAHELIVALSRPGNNDLLFAVVNHMGADDSFQWTFTKPNKLDFDRFASLTRQADALIRMLDANAPEDLRGMSARYDEYLAQVDDHKLSEAQTVRFDALVNVLDDSSWSGAVYGVILRRAQYILRQMLQN